jgi:hypothetical protein
MNIMSDETPSSNPLSKRDVALLIGVVATLEGALFSHERAVHAGVRQQPSEFYDHLLGHLHDRLGRDGALMEGPPPGRAVRQVLSDLVGRLHFAWGAYDAPPASEPVMDLDAPPK